MRFPLPSGITICAALLWPLAAAAAPTPSPAVHAPDASAAAAKDDNGTFLKLHEAILRRGQSGPIGLLFLGDSITARWILAPHIWNAYYGKYSPANFGVGGDKTQNVIWRIEHGELDHVHPQVVVFLLGTNNTGSNGVPSNTAAEITAADTKIVHLIQAKIPEAKVLILGIFPRGARKNRDGSLDTGVEKNGVIRAVNAELAKLDDGRTIRFLDIGSVFLGQDGKPPFSIMPEQLHPSPAGYQLWADAMKPTLDQMLGEKPGKPIEASY